MELFMYYFKHHKTLLVVFYLLLNIYHELFEILVLLITNVK